MNYSGSTRVVPVPDPSVELKEPGVSKAEALRRAQRKLIGGVAFTHPFYWSPFLLVSNWL